MTKIKLSLSRLTPDEIVGLGKQVKTAMTANADFPAPNPTLTALGTVIATAEAKVAAQKAAQLVAVQATNDRDAALEELSAVLTLLADYVQNVSGGNPVLIQSAGMSTRSLPQRNGVLTQVLNLAVSAGDDEGELDAGWDAVRGAKSYQVQLSADPITPTSWRDVTPTSDSRTTIDGLVSGVRTWMRVRAIAKGKQGPWSDPAVKTVP